MHRTIAPQTYVIVCALLIVLTVLTVTVSFFDVAGIWHVTIGLTIGVVKASLVVLFFMHAIVSDRLTWVVIAAACFWLAILVVQTFADYFTREMIPYVPGH